MDIFDRAYSNLGKLWEAMWDNKTRRKPRVGRRAVSKSRLERYTNAFIADDRTYEDNPKVAARNQRADLKKFVQKQTPPPTVDLTVDPPAAKPAKRDVIKDDRTVEEKESQMPKSSELAERIEKAQERVEKVDKSWPTKKSRLLFQPKLMGTVHRRMLFMNPGDQKIRMAVYAILHSMELPKWAAPYASQLSVQGDRLYFDVFGKPMPFAYSSEKREKVKRLYFDPKKASTIQPLTDALREMYCNITKRDVTTILKPSRPTSGTLCGTAPPRFWVA
jgi:hypothetical protein